MHRDTIPPQKPLFMTRRKKTPRKTLRRDRNYTERLIRAMKVRKIAVLSETNTEIATSSGYITVITLYKEKRLA